MLDHGYLLWLAIEACLNEKVPLRGGWHIARLEKPTYPIGYMDLTGSTPFRGQAYYSEIHRGLISVYDRSTTGEASSPEEAFALSHLARSALDEGFPSLHPGFEITQFSGGELIPRNIEGSTWGRVFQFNARTHEVRNG